MTITVTTVLRLADNTTVPIVLRATRHGWLQAITIDGDPVQHCKRGHLLVRQTIYMRSNGATECRICRRRRNGKKSRAKSLRYYYRSGKARRQKRNQARIENA